jgi:hypothetical protein
MHIRHENITVAEQKQTIPDIPITENVKSGYTLEECIAFVASLLNQSTMYASIHHYLTAHFKARGKGTNYETTQKGSLTNE